VALQDLSLRFPWCASWSVSFIHHHCGSAEESRI